jgi:LysM repeat protein
MAGRSPARFLAPLALVAFGVALVVVVNHGTPDRKSSQNGQPARPASSAGAATRGGHKRKHHPRTYVVKPGDTPSGIAEKTGVSLDLLLELNPNLDPQTLTPGERLKLRR